MACLMPAMTSLRIVYHANPTEGNILARLIAAYRITMIVATPTLSAASSAKEPPRNCNRCAWPSRG